MKIIARIYTEFDEKFGIPRQSGIVEGTVGRIVFEPEYRAPEAFRGIEGYSHLWLIWQFSEAQRDEWSPTVRPPRLGGNKRIGVFASRSPYRPNSLGLSVVRLERIEKNLNLKVGGCTEDGKFSLEATRCIGACGLAPVLTIGEEVYGRLVEDDIDGILAKYK